MSIRLRLSQTDLRNFAEHGAVQETINFDPEGDQRFIFRLKRDTAVGSVIATFANNTLTVSVPTDRADEWTSTDLVGFDNGDTSAPLKIVIEKDFTCLVPRVGEDDRDTFPHPHAGNTC